MADGKKTISADASNPFRTILNLWPYMWPAGRTDLKMRVVWASVFLLISKFVLLLVPYFFKWSIDALNGKMDLNGIVPNFMMGAVNVPYMDAVLYLLGISREEVVAADAEAGITTPAPPL